jgi:formylglycine-generating enzyme required for sulfatase activity
VKVALLIGVSEYEPGLNPLPAAVKDLDAIKEVLLHPEMGGFSESDIVLLKNPNRQEIEESIETLFSNRHKDDLVVLFFSGHGIKDDAGKLYLGARKTRKTPQGDLVRSSAVAANLVHENMSRSRSKRQVVILDSCFSGAFAEGLAAKDDGTVDIRTQLGVEGRAVLTSSSSTQYSFEQEGEELSLYTRFLVEGIKTGAADLDGDDVISIDELHEYASRRVREVKPELKPEIYAVREGFKILLSRVPQGDPHQKYQKEVARCGKRGQLTIISRSILDTWRARLGLSVEEAKVLEDEVLEPYRREFQQKLQQYERVVTEVIERDTSINDDTRLELQNLQNILELRQEDTVPIEAKVAAHLKRRKQNLKTYKEAFSEALRQESPHSEATRLRLQQMRQQLELRDADVNQIESLITVEVETYRRNLQEYEQALVAATQQEYPLNEFRRNELRQQQQHLGLSDIEIAPIEAKVTTQVETYQQKLQQYEVAFTNATQRKHSLGEANRTQLTQMWQTLGLSEEDVKEIEAPTLSQIETYRLNLRQYEQEFANATEQQYPLGVAKRCKLLKRQQALSLKDEDVAPLENLITASIEEHLQNLHQYEQVFSDSIKFESPVREATRKELQRLQELLSLSDEEVATIESRLLDPKQAEDELNHVLQEQETAHIREQAVLIEDKYQQAKQKRQELERNAQIWKQSTLKQPLKSKQFKQDQTDPILNPRTARNSSSLSDQELTIKRRQLLKWGGFGGGGLVVALIGNQIFQRKPSSLETVQSSFETVLLDERGEVTQRSIYPTKLVKEALGNGIELELVNIPVGSFQMGSPRTEAESTDRERPQHSVMLKSFFMGKYPVTQAQWKAVASFSKIKIDLNPDPSRFKGNNLPVETVSWNEAVEFCARLSQKTGKKYRLPSESEWEYACRSETKTPFHFGETITQELANYDGSTAYGKGPKGAYRKKTTEVGSFKVANAYGLYEMHGNVWEWCQDYWHDSYEGSPADGSAWITGGNASSRLLRGGSWVNDPGECRSAFRIGLAPDYRLDTFGFRVVCDSPRTS